MNHSEGFSAFDLVVALGVTLLTSTFPLVTKAQEGSESRVIFKNQHIVASVYDDSDAAMI